MIAVKNNLNLGMLTNPQPNAKAAVKAAKHAGGKVVEVKPTTVVKGKTVQVVGTKGGAISQAQQAAKASKIKATGKGGTKAGVYSGSQTLKVLGADDSEEKDGNPHRAGTYRHKAFAAAAGCKTVAEYIRTGYKTKYLKTWAKRNYVRIV